MELRRPAHDGPMPRATVLDDDALHRLGEQLGDSDVLCRFLRHFLALLDQRIARLGHAMAAPDQDAWMDAVLSLKSSSAMAGAQALAEQAAVLQQECVSRLPCCAPPEPTAHAAVAPGGTSAGTTCAATTGCAITRRTEYMASLNRVASETARQLRIFLERAGAASHR